MKWEHANQLVFRETESDYEIICECKEEYAPLIAAAPDLLRECKKALKRLEDDYSEGGSGYAQYCEPLLQAIHKAEARLQES